MGWPVYPKEHAYRLVTGNLESHIGIVTLFSPVESLLNGIDKKNFAAAGQLVTKSQGLSAIIRNCLLHGGVTDLVVSGENPVQTSEALKALIENGVDENYNVKGIEFSRIDKEIPRDALDLFRKNTRLHFRDKLDNQFLESIPKGESYSEFGKLIFPDHEFSAPKIFPGEKGNYFVREKTVADAWPEILWLIRKFGEIKPSRYGLQQQIRQLTVEITDEDPENPKWADYFLFSKKELEDYMPQMLTGEKGNFAYTYGNRIFSYFDTNQLDYVVKELEKDKDSRSAVISLWDQKGDPISGHHPCIVTLQTLRNNSVLDLISVIRSNDMVKAWPMNALALRRLQSMVAKRSGMELGSLTTNSISAHLYVADSDQADIVVARRKPSIYRQDPRGNLIISVENGLVKIIHRSPAGEDLAVYAGRSFAGIQKQMLDNGVLSLTSHAIYVGAEIQKAIIASKTGVQYVQDRPLNL